MKDDTCLFCKARAFDHLPNCPVIIARDRKLKEAETLSIVSEVEGYRLKDKITGQFYEPQAVDRTSLLGRLYSKRGIISLLSYNFGYFQATQTQWEILEYDVAEEIKLIDKMDLGAWSRFKKLIKTKEKK